MLCSFNNLTALVPKNPDVDGALPPAVLNGLNRVDDGLEERHQGTTGGEIHISDAAADVQKHGRRIYENLLAQSYLLRTRRTIIWGQGSRYPRRQTPDGVWKW